MNKEIFIRKLRELVNELENETESWDLAELLSKTDWRKWKISERPPRDGKGIVVERKFEPYCSIEIRPLAEDVVFCPELAHSDPIASINWTAIHALSDYIKDNYE